MTKAKLAQKIKSLQTRLAELDSTIHEIATSGYASATLSAGTGSKSYTRADLAQLRVYRTELRSQIESLVAAARGTSTIRHVVTVRS